MRNRATVHRFDAEDSLFEARFSAALDLARLRYLRARADEQDEFRRVMALEADRASRAGFSDRWIGERLAMAAARVRQLIETHDEPHPSL